MVKSSTRTELGLSSDQFYRRIRLLREASLIHPERGKNNALILSPADESVLRGFVAIEQDHPERGLEWCIERLRYEREHTHAATLEGELAFARTEVRQLRYALQRVTRNPFRRFWEALRRRWHRADASDTAPRDDASTPDS